MERKLLYQLYKNEIAIIKIGDIQKEPRIKKCIKTWMYIITTTIQYMYLRVYKYYKRQYISRDKDKWIQNIHVEI